MNTLGLRTVGTGGGGETVYLIGPVSADIENILSTSIFNTVSVDIESSTLSVNVDRALSVNVDDVILTAEICK